MNGDIVIANGNIAMIEGNELTAQTLRTVMGTNKGEWFLNENEGIDRYQLLGKGITKDMQLMQCQDACSQVDENLNITEFNSGLDKPTRKASLTFKVQRNGEAVAEYVEREYEENNANAASKLAEANATLAAYRSATERLERRLDGEL